MAKLIANYETVMVFSVKDGEESVNALVEKFNSLISENGTINNVDTWGQRRLAYPINDETEGYYVVVEFSAAPEFPAELDRIYKITDGVLRSLIIAKDEEA
ncbi:30S ribosomal protein S6 [Youxingia wuxianensis]|uniref:Small ribosomal subunit protein bS6 n=1 Tax=Youxingia wuxianensis TaxID=2763678 RepID=A0A926IGK6_9FIRM|nr:30S ribosomal protein S6 [Youxingia wuxianensis]MBC8584969.1 30S ribosomal protein S6 [Youxingia wuxianensis]